MSKSSPILVLTLPGSVEGLDEEREIDCRPLDQKTTSQAEI